MANKYDSDEPEIYFDEEFDYGNHKQTFDRTVDDLSDFINGCARSRRIRTCEWDGQNEDLTKSGDNAFPFRGSSDSQQWVSQNLMSTSTAINCNALRRSKIQAYPRKATDIKRAPQVSVFLKYLRDAGIDNFWREAELADNYYKEKGIMVTYYGYSPARMIPYLKKFDLEEIANTFPEVSEFQEQANAGLEQALAEMLADENRVDEVLEMFNSVEGWEVNKKRVKKALTQLRKTGVAEIPVLVADEGKAEMMALAPDTEFYAPASTQNFQDSAYCYVRKPMTPQEVLSRVKSEGWDQEWADYAVEHAKGVSGSVSGQYNSAFLNLETSSTYNKRDLIDVVFSYEKLIDREDGAQGIYLTIWSPEFGGSDVEPEYAKRVLLSGRKKFPFVVNAPYEAKTLYSASNWPERLASSQKSKKVFCDANIDESSYAISPALTVSPTWDYGRPQPGGVYPTRPGQQAPAFIQKPSRFDVTRGLIDDVTREAMELVGLNPNSPYSQQKQQHDINRFLSHHAEVLKGIYEEYKMNGPDELYIRVTGNPQPVEFVKDPDEAEMHISVSFNSIYDDPEQMKELRETIREAINLDPNGRINREAGVDMLLNIADPMLADAMLLPTEQGVDKITVETQADIVSMAGGVAKGAPQDAAALRLQVVQQYVESPTGLAKLNSDQGFQFLLSEYMKQLQFQVTQQKNAQIGRLGTAPATMGNIETQGLGNG